MPNENQDQPPVFPKSSGLDELRIKVAELCGWKRIHYRTAKSDTWLAPNAEPRFETDEITGINPRPRECAPWDEPEDPLAYLPDFPSDLNACAEFERTLFAGYRGAYFANLGMIIGQAIQPTGWYDAYLLGTATPEQRCRAFIATMEDKT